MKTKRITKTDLIDAIATIISSTRENEGIKINSIKRSLQITSIKRCNYTVKELHTMIKSQLRKDTDLSTAILKHLGLSHINIK